VDMRDGINENNNEHTHTLARMKIFFMKWGEMREKNRLDEGWKKL
jgi:hypothetical protein